MKSAKTIITIVIIVAIAGVAGITTWKLTEPRPVMLQGEVVAQSYKVASKIPGRIDSLSLKVGDYVKKGEFLYSLTTPEIDAKLEQVKAMVRAADAQSDMAQTGLRPQQKEVVSQIVEKAKVAMDLAQVTYKRVENLYNDGVVPQQRLDEAKAMYEAAKRSHEIAKLEYSLAQEGSRKEQKVAAQAIVSQAMGGLQEINSLLTEAKQYSPIDGRILTVGSEKGELVGIAYPVVTVIDTKDVWFSFNIKETLLPKIEEGVEVYVHIPAIKETIRAKVSYIAVEAHYATWAATRASGDFDIRTFEVRLHPVEHHERLRPGMTALVDWNTI